MSFSRSLRRLGARATGMLRPARSPSPPQPRSAGVTIAYAPEHDGEPDPGEVVWAWVPYEDDATQGKDRPVLVVGWDGNQLAAVPLSSRSHAQRPDAGEWVPVGTGAWDHERRPSYADAARLLRFAPREVRREGAALDRARFDAVVAAVRAQHGAGPLAAKRPKP